MNARFKIDEDLPGDAAKLLVARGYDAMTVAEQGYKGSSDSVVWELVQREKRWLLTGDKGFGDLRAYPPGTHAGIILLRPYQESRQAFLDLLDAAIQHIDFQASSGATIVVTHHGIRVRRAPL